MIPPQLIPRFALYGESGDPFEPAFVHIETIAARSSLHDWEIKPHRHRDFHQLLFVGAGAVALSIDGKDRTLTGPALVIAPAGVVHGFRFDPDVEGKVLSLSVDFANRASGGEDPLQRLFARAQILCFDRAARARLDRLADEMLSVQAGPAEGRPALMLALAEAWTRLAAACAAPAPHGPESDARIARLRLLIEQHFREQRGVSFYAQALGLTPRTLARITAAHFGCAPQALLHRRLALEAGRLLHYTNAPSVQIAAELGFDDPAYFSRFYLRMTGQRPNAALRRRLPSGDKLPKLHAADRL